MESFSHVFNNFIDSKSKFFHLAEGEERLLTFISVEPVVSNFKGREIASLRYTLEVDGKTMYWDRTSRELATQMRQYASGDTIKIRRLNKIKYLIEKMN